MDREDQISLFLNALGGGTDREFATSVLEAHGWDLQAAMQAVLGDAPPSTTTAPPPGGNDFAPPVEHGDNGGSLDAIRAPMRTGYTDVLMGGPTSRAEELRQQREAEERKKAAEEERRRNLEAQKKAAEQAEMRRNEQQAASARADAEVSALERKRAEMKAKMEEVRRAAGLMPDSQPAAAGVDSAPTVGTSSEASGSAPVAPAATGSSLPTIADRLASKPTSVEPNSVDAEPQASAAKVQRVQGEDASMAKPVASAPVAQPEATQKVDAAKEALMALRRKYWDADPEGLMTCLQTLRTYLNNLANSPHEQKFQRIKCDNNAFCTRVAPYEGAVDVLLGCGFERDGAWLAVPDDFAKTKGSKIWDVLAKVEFLIEQVKSKS
mmetsp:Transcript_26005/g.60101  ORF Transcript_26005/g.60101 Transcript_26005/m.60101 type:complete len:381 (+) Transcript_26005:91-1233(+)